MTSAIGDDNRRFWGIVWAAITVFAIYISLVPFRFDAFPTGLSVFEAMRTKMIVEARLPSNILANAIMFVPFGLSGLFVVTAGNSARRRGASLVVVFILSLVLSLAIEVAQLFVPRRTPSWTDVAAQSAGTLAGMLALIVLAPAIGQENPGARRLRGLEAALSLYALLLVAVLLDPSGSVRSPRITTWIGDAAIASPIGILVLLRSSDRYPAAVRLVVVAGFATLVSGARSFIDGSAATLSEVAAHLSGVVSGMLMTLTARAGALPRLPRFAPLMPLCISAAVYAVYNLAPFDFDWSGQLLQARMGRFATPPFQSYYQNAEFKALRDVFIKTTLALPLGLLFATTFRANRGGAREKGAVLWIATTIVFFALVELGQVLLPSRYPDNTDTILAAIAVIVGIRIGDELRASG